MDNLRKEKKSKFISPRLRTAKSTNAGDIGGVHAAKALFRVDTIMRRGCNEIELCLIYDFVSVFKKTIIQSLKFSQQLNVPCWCY